LSATPSFSLTVH